MKAGMVLLMSIPLALSACGGDAESGDDEEIARQLEGIAGLAVGAYASAGPEALFDYLSEAAAEGCSPDALSSALSDEIQPTGFAELKDVNPGGDEATAIVVMNTQDGEVDGTWTFVRNDTSWRIDDMPGLGDCRS